MFSVEYRDVVRERTLEIAARDARVVAGAVIGSSPLARPIGGKTAQQTARTGVVLEQRRELGQGEDEYEVEEEFERGGSAFFWRGVTALMNVRHRTRDRRRVRDSISRPVARYVRDHGASHLEVLVCFRSISIGSSVPRLAPQFVLNLPDFGGFTAG